MAAISIIGTAKPSNENKMSDGGRERASLGVEMWKSSQKLIAQRSDVRSIAWLGLFGKWLNFKSHSGGAPNGAKIAVILLTDDADNF